jgi:hypothetical protein
MTKHQLHEEPALMMFLCMHKLQSDVEDWSDLDCELFLV